MTGFNPTISCVPDKQSPCDHQKIPLSEAIDSIKTTTRYIDIDKLDRPAFCFQGEFFENESIKKDTLQSFSGIFHFDIDHIDNPEVIKGKLNTMFGNSLVFMFTSPSGKGVKGGVRICQKLVMSDADYKKVFEQFKNIAEWHGITLDEQCKNISRLCFFNYDAGAYYNPDVVEYDYKPLAQPVLNAHKKLLDVFKEFAPGGNHAAALKLGNMAGNYISGGVLDEVVTVDLLRTRYDIVGCEDDAHWRAVIDGIENGKKSPKTDWAAELSAFITEFNKTHAAVIIGGKHRIMRTIDGISGEYYEYIDPNALKAIYKNQPIQTGVRGDGSPVYGCRVEYWLKDRNSRVYRKGVKFSPGMTLGAEYFNTWEGFAVSPVAGDCSLIKQHIEKIVCGGDPELIDYFYNWCAFTLQNPSKPAGAALVLRGEKGSGKGVTGHFLSSLWGRHGMHISNGAHLVGKFNGHLADTCFLFSDEAFYSGNKEHEQVLKALITEPTLAIERKGIDTIQQPNYLKVFMATNSDWAVPATRDERRFCVFDVSSERIGDRTYFDALDNEIKNPDVMAAFLHDMLNRDIESFRTGAIPESDGLKAQRIGTLESGGKWLMHFLQSEYDYGRNIDAEIRPRSASEIFKEYMDWCKVAGMNQYQIWTNTKFGKYLSSLGYTKNRGKNGIVWVLGTLGEAVAKFERYEKLTTGII